MELLPRGITVNVVAPGPTDTPMLNDPTRAGTPPKVPPLGRLIRPQEVAGLVSFLLGPDAGAITGQHVVMCGGASLSWVPDTPTRDLSTIQPGAYHRRKPAWSKETYMRNLNRSPLRIITELDSPIVMRDGSILRADNYRPEGTVSTLLVRSPYGELNLRTYATVPALAAGFAVVLQQVPEALQRTAPARPPEAARLIAAIADHDRRRPCRRIQISIQCGT